MKLATSLLSSAFLLSALSNVTGVRLHSSKNFPADLRALVKEKKKKKCRPGKVALEDHPTWAKATGYWMGQTFRYRTDGSKRLETFFFDRTIAKGNYIASKSVEFVLDDSNATKVDDTAQNLQYFVSSCTKRKKKQKRGIFEGNAPGTSVSVYADPNISNGGDAILYEVNDSTDGMVQQSVERFFEVDGKEVRIADTDFYYDGFAHGEGEKFEKDDFYAAIDATLLAYSIDATFLCGKDNCETFFEDSLFFG